MSFVQRLKDAIERTEAELEEHPGNPLLLGVRKIQTQIQAEWAEDLKRWDAEVEARKATKH
jgi:uncharacterized small protein (DUF1192 family)